jgi:RHS repeat-associated protein
MIGLTLPSGEVKACRSIVLKPGCHFTASPGKSLTLKIDPDLCDAYGVEPAISQNSPVTAPGNSVTVVTPLIAASSDADINNTNSVKVIHYSDGLGRANIQIAKAITPLGKDMVFMEGYDYSTQTALNFLPFAINASDNIPNPEALIQAAKDFHSDNYPYQSVNVQQDVLAPTISMTAPGQTHHTKNKKQVTSQWINFAACVDYGDEDLFRYPLDRAKRYATVNNGVKLMGEYDNNQLVYNYSEDEDGKKSCVYYDLHGKLILVRAITAYETDSGGDYTSIVGNDTYYVYDDMDRLRFVLSPEASERMNSTNTVYSSAGDNTAGNPIDQYAYIYRYDGKNQCIAKKLPGAAWIYYVYDKAGRIILTQDGNQRTGNEWTFIKYNRQGQAVQSGKTTSTASHASLRSQYAEIALTENWVDDSGYSNNHPMGTGSVVLTQNFYNNHKFKSLYSSINSSMYVWLSATANTGYDNMYRNTVENQDISLRGMLTGTSVKTFDQSFEQVSALYYDRQARLAIHRMNNYTGMFDYYYYKYKFSGQLDKFEHFHRSYDFYSPSMTEEYTFEYDHAERLTNTYHSLNTFTPVKIQELQYDESGRVKKKLFNSSTAMGPRYTYNIQGQLVQISSPSDNFSQKLSYHDGEYIKYYNGSISEMRESINNKRTATRYRYDALNRLEHSQYNSDFTDNVEEPRIYETAYSFDKNGNITDLRRDGYGCDYYTLNEYDRPTWYCAGMDLLTMSYSGNRLTKVSDDATMDFNHPHFIDRNSSSCPVEYTYDANGNITGDYNKDIAWIKYNLLNLPSKIQFGNGNKTEYIYNASGTKYRAIYSTKLSTMQIPLGAATENIGNIQRQDTMDYCGNFVYSNRKLKYILTPDGYIDAANANPENWKHVYLLKDYQNNVRMEITANNTLANPSSGVFSPRYPQFYYPFGTGEATGNIFAYSGNEYETKNGLRQHDFHFRWYDQVLGRFTTMDPLSEQDYATSPYAYCGNDPINRIDPWGLAYYQRGSSVFWDESDEPTITYDKKTYDNIGDYLSIQHYGMVFVYHRNKLLYEYKASKSGFDFTPGYTDSDLGYNWPETATHEDRNSEKENSTPRWIADNVVNGTGGFGTGMEKADGTFRMTKNGKFDIKYYAVSPKTGRGWSGGSKAKINTYSMANWGRGIGRGASIVSAGIGISDIVDGIEADGGFGYNAQMATAKTVGWMLGNSIGNKGGAAIGSFFFPPFGTIAGSIIIGYAGGWGGSKLGEATVDWFYGY